MNKINTKIISLSSNDLDDAELYGIAAGLKQGKLLIFPTETVYGIGALNTCKDSLKNIFKVKGRSKEKPLAYYVNSIQMMAPLNLQLPDYFEELAQLYLPGPLTIIACNDFGLKLGVRFPKHEILTKLISFLPDFLRGTSANLSGANPVLTAQAAYSIFQGKVDFIIDSGKTCFAEESTVIDFSEQIPVFLRKGKLFTAINEFLLNKGVNSRYMKKILVVCTGNTCRSPMVSGVIEKILKDKSLDNSFSVDSCGIYAPFSIPASKDAISVLGSKGVDISSHRSKSITTKLLLDSDKILVMTKDHELALTDLLDNISDRICVLNIEDPIGRGKSYYEQTYNMICDKLEETLSWIIE